MIARVDHCGSTTLLEDLAADEQRDLLDALFVVRDLADVEPLTFVGLHAASAASPAGVAAMAPGRRVVALVDLLDGAMREHLAETFPAAELRDVPLPPGSSSVAGMLGFDVTGATKWTEEAGLLARETWLDWVSARSVISKSPTPDGGVAFPVTALPQLLRDFVVEGARAQGVDAAYWIVPALAICAGCVGATRRVRITADWHEPCILWTAVVAPSGAGKSPPLKALLRPLRERDYHLHLRNVEMQQRHATEIEQWRAASSAERGEKPEPPPVLALTVDDATIEAIAMRLLDNARGLTLAPDELGSWLLSHDCSPVRPGGFTPPGTPMQRMHELIGSRVA